MRTEEEINEQAFEARSNVTAFAKDPKISYENGWRAGFKSCQDEKKVDVETVKELLKNSILKHGDTICYANYLITLLNDAEVILSCGLDKLRDDPTAQQHVDKIKEAILKHDSVIQQPQQPVESEAVELLNWTEDNGYTAVWSNKYKVRRWTQEPVLVNGSAEHFDRLVKDGIDAVDLVEIFRKEKGL